MADVPLTKAANIALTPDNTTGDVSNQDLRNMLTSIMGVHGEIYTNIGTTSQTGIGTSYTKLTTFSSDGADGVFDQLTLAAASDKITIPSGCDGNYRIVVNLGIVTGTASTLFTFAIFKGSTPATTGREVLCQLDATPNPRHVTLVADVALVATDDVEIHVKADGASKAITPETASLALHRLS